MSRPKLVIATNNPGKLREFQELLAGSGFELVTPASLGLSWDVEETGASFEENARLKAVGAARATGLLAFADDSGLEVDHLGGRPGIFSARYAGGDRTDGSLNEREQCEMILREMHGVPDEQRTARFRCVIAIATPADDVQTVDGVFEGRIAHAISGDGGFGYDPIFLVPERGVTSAELSPDEKNAISHRGKAARRALAVLKAMSHGG
ncbi:MAG: RdgB/HAM1 family non-canonical purine NTP pyrophosphatase [Dehalococcoidia bacterium]